MNIKAIRNDAIIKTVKNKAAGCGVPVQTYLAVIGSTRTGKRIVWMYQRAMAQR